MRSVYAESPDSRKADKVADKPITPQCSGEPADCRIGTYRLRSKRKCLSADRGTWEVRSSKRRAVWLVIGGSQRIAPKQFSRCKSSSAQATGWRSARSSPRTGKPSTWRRSTGSIVLDGGHVRHIWRVPDEHRSSPEKAVGAIAGTQTRARDGRDVVQRESVDDAYTQSPRPHAQSRLAR